MSFQQGVTGLNAAGKNLDVIGNNVANASTIGAKSSRAEFADIYARASGGGISVGIGVSTATVAQQFSQGNISSTSNPLDVAINGGGFFQLKDDNGLLQYSRNGQFKVNSSGYIVNDQGLKLLGHAINSLGSEVPGPSTPIQLPTAGIAPTVTSKLKLEVNLDSRAATTSTVALAADSAATSNIDFTNDKTYNNTTSLNIYDKKGQTVSLSYYFQKSDVADTWNVYASANGEAVVSPKGSPAVPIATVTFSSDGKTVTGIKDAAGATTDANGVAYTATSFPLPEVPSTGTGATMTEPIDGIRLDMSTLTQNGSVFSPTDVTQNGFPPGRLTSVAVQDDGSLVASYSTGQSAPIAKLELANFRNTQGLQPLGGNSWAATYVSGDPLLGAPGSGSLGLLSSQSLEESNVDLTGELVNMMVAQRIYQANAQTIKTQDSVMQTLVNLK